MRGALLALLFLCACRRQVSAPLTVVVQGATAVQRVDGGVRYWFDAPDAPRLVTEADSFSWADGAAVSATRDGGTTWALSRPADGARPLVVRLGDASARLDFVFRPSSRAISARFAELAANDVEAARAALDASPPDEWPWACAGLARSAAAEASADAFAACSDGALARGFVSEHVSRRIAAVHWAHRLRQHARMQALVAEVEAALREFPDARLASQLHYQQGAYLAETGRLREADATLQKAVNEALAAGQPAEAVLYRSNRAAVLAESGQHLDALAEADAVRRGDTRGLSDGDALSVRVNVSWVQLLALTAGVGHVDTAALRDDLTALIDATAALEQSLDASNAATNLAWLEYSQGRFEPARAALLRARTLGGDTHTVEALFMDWLDGRLALAANDGARATKHFEALLAAGVEHQPDAAWRAQLGLAEAWLLQRKPVEATKWLGEARRTLSTQARTWADPAQRVVFLQDRRRAIADAVDAFVRAGRCELAWRLADDAQAWLARSFEADRRVRLSMLDATARAAFEADEARWSQTRQSVLSEAEPSLASVEELAAWKLGHSARLDALRVEATALASRLDALAPVPERPAFERTSLADDEALLERFFSATASLAFLVRRSGEVTCAADVDALVSPKALKGVKHVAIVDGGAGLATTTLRRLLADATVAFVPSAAWLQVSPVDTSGDALVVGDPRGDLPSARAEAREVMKTLGGELLEGDGATLDAITSRWMHRPVLHFAGHGRLSVGAPWDARLDLARGQTLDFELLLSRRPAPRLVVLSGCETGRSLDAPVDGLGLAEGFLAGGAVNVLATTVEVDDAKARRFIGRFYAHGGATKPTQAWRDAALEADAEGDDSWREWRLLGAR